MPQPSAQHAGSSAVALTPQEFLDWANGKLHEPPTMPGVRLPPPWQPGQHFALLGKTREGKTNFAVWLLKNCRKFVLALDPKGGDETLAASGWPRVTGVPPRKNLPKEIDQARAEGRPVRLIVGRTTRTAADDMLNRQLMGDAIEYARQAGGWALYVDEHQVLSDQRMFRLGPDIARMAISAARDGVSVVSSMQYLAWVEKAPTRQATLLAVWRTRSRELIKLVADITGRPWQEIAAAVDELPKYNVLIISDELRAPMLVVRPPKVT